MARYDIDYKDIRCFSRKLAKVDKELAYEFHVMTGMGILNRLKNILTKAQFDLAVEAVKQDAIAKSEEESKVLLNETT